MNLWQTILALLGIPIFAFVALIGLGDVGQKHRAASIIIRIASALLALACAGLVIGPLFEFAIWPAIIAIALLPAGLLGLSFRHSLSLIVHRRWLSGFKWLFFVIVGIVVGLLVWSWFIGINLNAASVAAVLAIVAFGLGIFGDFFVPEFLDDLIGE